MAEAAPIFTATSRLSAAVALLNRVPLDKLPHVLTRVAQRLHVRDQRTFEAAEEEQLQGLLSLPAADLDTLLEACSYIYEQAAYHGVAAEPLLAQLRGVGVEEAPAEAMGRVWAEQGPGLVQRLRERAFGAPKVLSDSQWRLHLQIGQQNLTRLAAPTAVFEFNLQRPGAVERRDDERFMAEFSHEELSAFFDDIERIQEQLDALA